jgi:DNA-binding NarL/FixJ family response regulator
MPLADAVSLADDLARAWEPAVRGQAPASGDGLSSREREVLALLVGGATDREIAAVLFISPRTASKHVGSILAKLGAGSRAEAAIRAVRDGLVEQG